VKKQKQTKKDISLKPDTTAEERGILSRYIIYKKMVPKHLVFQQVRERVKRKLFASSSEVCKTETKKCFQSVGRGPERVLEGERAEKGKHKSHRTLTQTKPHKVQSCKEKHR
jgi:hypothetical protein